MYTHSNGSTSLRARFAGLGLAAFAAMALACATPQIAFAEGDVGEGDTSETVLQDTVDPATEGSDASSDNQEGASDETDENLDTDSGTEVSTGESQELSSGTGESDENQQGSNGSSDVNSDTQSNVDQSSGSATEQNDEQKSDESVDDTTGDAGSSNTTKESATGEDVQITDDSSIPDDQQEVDDADSLTTIDGAVTPKMATGSTTAGTDASATPKATDDTATSKTASNTVDAKPVATTETKTGTKEAIASSATVRLDASTARKLSAAAIDWSQGHWQTVTIKGKKQIRWVSKDGKSVYKNGLIDPTWGIAGNKAGIWAYARPEGYIVRGKWTDGNGNVWLADSKGKLPKTSNGWLVTGKFDNGNLQRYYMTNHHATTGFITTASGKHAYGIPKKGYVTRGAYKTEKGWTLANNDGLLKCRRWIVTDKFGTKGTYKRYYLQDNGSVARKRIISPNKDNVDYYAYALKNGVILRGAKKVGSWTFVADNDGKLATADKEGWIVTKKFGTKSKKRYYLEKTKVGFYAAKNGYSNKGYAHYNVPGKGYVLTNARISANGSSYRANSKGKLSPLKYLNGIDIASWQAGIKVQNVDAAFVIVKATEGSASDPYVNPYWKSMVADTLKSGKLLGLYHYADGGDPIAEANFFYKHIKSYVGKAVLCLDWEGEGNKLFDTGKDMSWCKKFLDHLYKLTGVRGLLYTSKNYVRAYDWSSVSKNYKLWCAQYADMEDVNGYQVEPWTDSHSFGSWGLPTIYQYTGTGRIKGYSGYLDLNQFYGTKATWQKLCAKQ